MVLFNRAYCYDNADSVENSITDYRRLLLCNPNDFMYQIAIPRVYIHHKRYVEAKKEIDEILSKKPESERGLVYKGVLEYEMSNFEKSMASINLCLLKFPNSIEGLVTKAKILIKLGKVSESCLALEDANKKMNPGYFGGQLGYMHSFQDEIKTLQSSNCK